LTFARRRGIFIPCADLIDSLRAPPDLPANKYR
jgi:hypothetical protein